jgi:hypothetical protein
LKINKRVVFNFEKFLTEMKKNWRRLYSFAELLLLAVPSRDVFNLIRPGEMFTACCVYSVDAITQGLCAVLLPDATSGRMRGIPQTGILCSASSSQHLR